MNCTHTHKKSTPPTIVESLKCKPENVINDFARIHSAPPPRKRRKTRIPADAIAASSTAQKGTTKGCRHLKSDNYREEQHQNSHKKNVGNKGKLSIREEVTEDPPCLTGDTTGLSHEISSINEPFHAVKEFLSGRMKESHPHFERIDLAVFVRNPPFSLVFPQKVSKKKRTRFCCVPRHIIYLGVSLFGTRYSRNSGGDGMKLFLFAYQPATIIGSALICMVSFNQSKLTHSDYRALAWVSCDVCS